MISIGKTKDGNKRLDEVMRSAHNLDIRIQLLDLDHNYLKDLSDVFADGLVSVDADAEITRALDLTLFDPFKQIALDPDSPSKSSVFITNMVKVVYVVTPADRSEVFEIPVFCGPIDEVGRDDVWIDIKALGKESLSLDELWRGKTYTGNQERTHVIKSILQFLVGETKFSIPDKSTKLGHKLKLAAGTKPWQVAKKIASSMGYQLFYDGRGVATLRKTSHKPVYKFTELDLVAVGQPVYDLGNIINAVDVKGKKKKKKPRITARVIAKRKHTLSPWNLGRKIKVGNATRIVARYLWEEISDDSIRSKKEARRVGSKRLKSGLLSGYEVKSVGIPCPRLQELDPVRIETDDVKVTYISRKFTIPLVAGDDATYGYLKRMTPKGGARAYKNTKNDKTKKKKKKGNRR